LYDEQPEEKHVTKPAAQSKQLKAVMAAGLGLAALTATIPAAPALAQTEVSADTQLKDLIGELQTQLERGEKERLIDPWFLRDLRQAIDRYDNPWDTVIFEDSFSTRGSRPAPPWQVVSGEMLIDWRYGMRSVVEPVAVEQPETQEQPEEPDDPLGQIFGALLKKATGTQQQTQSQPTLDLGTETTPAVAIVAKPVSNAFSIRAELTTRSLDGLDAPRFEMGPYQGQDATAGYRLAVLPGSRPSLELTSTSSRGTVSTVDLYDEGLSLEDGKAHVIVWTRTADGRMAVSVDGTEAINVSDRRFTGGFDGFSVANQGGDFALRSIRIEGTD
jgi:hypothetical protein